MKSKLHIAFYLVSIFILGACGGTQDTMVEDYEFENFEDGVIQFTFFHINDVYEIAPLEGGKVGGMARVATLYNQLLEENPNTLFVHAGDFLNPSLLGTLKHEGKSIKGKQMVEAMNACGVDLVTLGNHEFDLKKHELQERLNESNFSWLATNVLTYNGEKLVPFHIESMGNREFLPETFTWSIFDEDGTEINIGIFGATINSTKKDWIYYEDYYQEAVKSYLELNCETDVVFGLTHLAMNQDLKLASMLPNVPLLMGGHDHENIIDTVGNVIVAKADANAKTAYVHRITFHKNTGYTEVSSELVPITDEIEDEPNVQAIVDKWAKIQDENLTQIIANPNEVIYKTTVPLDGREASIRNFQTNLGEIICKGWAHAASAKKANAAIMNGGSIRLDDQLDGNILAVDLFRAMPFGGKVWEIDIKGSDLRKILNQGLENKGIGGYLQWYNIEYNSGKKAWSIGGKPLASNRTYHICLNDYLAAYSETISPIIKQANVKYYKPKDEDKKDPRSDVRKAVIEYMKTL
jgi:2',3'-cyclic-nucleotide 2'-phosphodiesterase (5'-nucleotidase family)